MNTPINDDPVKIRRPSYARIEASVQQLGLLPGTSAKIFEFVDSCIVEVLENHLRNSNNPKIRARRIGNLRKISSQLKSIGGFLAPTAPSDQSYLRTIIVELVGRLLDPSAFLEILGVDLTSHLDERYFDRLSGERGGPMPSLMSDLRSAKQQVAAVKGLELLRGFLAKLNDVVAFRLELLGHGKPGAPEKWERNFLVAQLVRRYPAWTGKAATGSPGGDFMLFCHLVVEAVGIDAEGIELAVQRAIRREKTRQRRVSSKPHPL